MNQLKQIRMPIMDLTLSRKIRNAMSIFVFGMGLGIFSKWLDNMAVDDSVWWQHILGIFDLGNVFSLLGVWIVIAVCIAVFSSSPKRAGLNVCLFFLGMNIT